MISLIITTCCGDPEVADQHTPSRTGTMKSRERLLLDTILPAVTFRQSPDEIIVAGRPAKSLRRAFPKVKFLEVTPKAKWRTEAGHIRRIATEEAKGDILVYLADDHSLSLDFIDILRALDDGEWDVWCPERRHWLTSAPLNNGSLEFAALDGRPNPREPYMGWHCNVLRSWVPEVVRWDFLPETQDNQDLPMTQAWRDAGAMLRWGMPLLCFDVEAEAWER